MKKLATLDIETDPFKFGRVPLPFACGFFDGGNYIQTWGDDCIAEMVSILKAYQEPLEIFAHNGGKFDWIYFQDWLDAPLNFIHSRLLRAQLFQHTVRDSYAILPAPLRDFKKDKTNYAHFEREHREYFKTSISKYLKHDCTYLYEIVKAFTDRFGNPLTIAGISWKEARKNHTIRHFTETMDNELRPYYFGGRVECFEKGNLVGNFKVYDINSSYPNVMRNYNHPTGNIQYLDDLPHVSDRRVYFARIVADSNGALPIRTKQGLSFPIATDMEFFACSHEIKSALKHKLLNIHEVISCIAFSDTLNFQQFVDEYYKLKMNAGMRGDKTMRTVYKLLLNNAYGKSAQDPRRFFDYTFRPNDDEWEPWTTLGNRTLYRKHAELKSWSFWNVAIGASITSAARAYLLEHLQRAHRPVYCDTDSIICESLDARLDENVLGAWKLEAAGTKLDIAGKKMYALWSKGKCVKYACKGVHLPPRDIQRAASGVTIQSSIDAPSMKLGALPKFITRKIRRT